MSELIDMEARRRRVDLLSTVLQPLDVVLILKLPLLNIDEDYKLVWVDCQDGWYTVKSGYKEIKIWEKWDAAGSSTAVQHSNLVWK